MRVRAAAATWREREHRDEPLRALRRGVDRRESAGTLADQEPALLIEVALCPRPRDRRQEIQRRAFTRATEIGPGARAVRVAELFSAARAIATPHRHDHRIAATHPLADRVQRSVAADRAVGFGRGGGAVAHDDPRKRSPGARTIRGDHDLRVHRRHRHAVDLFAKRRVELLRAHGHAGGRASSEGQEQQSDHESAALTRAGVKGS